MRKIYDLLIKKNANTQYLNAILFWGGTAAMLGFIGQLSTIWASLIAIMEVSDISPQIVYTGYLSSFVTPLFGLIIFLVSAVCWWGLKNSNSILSGN
ncbi:MAG: hypothetical protein K8R74_05020 [Bacteroidales bacterium]|nr:hypothetical protein [Bacteroidales bacterium]